MKRAMRVVVLFLTVLILVSCSSNTTNSMSSTENDTDQMSTPTPAPTPTVDPNGLHIIQQGSPQISVQGICDFTAPELQSIPLGISTMSIPDSELIIVEHSTPITDIVTHALQGYSTSLVVASASYTPVYINEYYILIPSDKVGTTIAGIVAGRLDAQCSVDPSGWSRFDESIQTVYDTYKSSFPTKFVVS